MELKDRPLISVIVPVYQVEQYLERCVDSILNQSYHNLEIVLVDDGSTDKGKVICDRYGTQNTNVKVIHQQNQGLSAARNTGIEASTGEWICFIDSDDYIEENMLEIMLRTSFEDQSDMVICGFVRCDDKDHVIKVKSFDRQCIDSYEALERGTAESLFSFQHRLNGSTSYRNFNCHSLSFLFLPSHFPAFQAWLRYCLQ